MSKKSDNRRQQAKVPRQDGTYAKAKGAKGGATSKGAQRAAADQRAELKGVMDAARESAEALREAASALSRSAAQTAAQAAAQAQPAVQPQQPAQVQQLQTLQPAAQPQPAAGPQAAQDIPQPAQQPQAVASFQPEPVTRMAHNESMGAQVGFMPKEPEEKAGRRWESPIKSLRSAVSALTNRSEPEPEPEPYVPARMQIDYTPKPELLHNLPKFGDAPAVLPSPQELLASVPAISTTGQIVPVGGVRPSRGDQRGEHISIPAMYGGSPSISLDLPPVQVQDQIIEVPAQEVVYGEVQMPDSYLQPYDGMRAYDPQQYDPNAVRAYDPMQQIQMQVYDPTQPQPQQAWDPYGQPVQQDPYGQPMQQDPYAQQQMYQQDPYGQQAQPQQQDYQAQAGAQPFDPSMYGHGFDQSPQSPQYDPYGYGYDPYAEAAGMYPTEPVKGGKATASLILGILSILLAFIPPLGLILAVVAILLAKSYAKAGGTAPRAGTGRVCGIVGIILSLLLAVALGVFLAYFYGGLYGEANAGAIMGYLQTTPLKSFL